jgi:DNA polymerase-3 subunit beta
VSPAARLFGRAAFTRALLTESAPALPSARRFANLLGPASSRSAALGGGPNPLPLKTRSRVDPMKVTVERAALLRSLGHVHRVVERRNTIPILSNVLLRSDGSGLRLKATDLDIEVTETIAADAAQGGATTVPAHVIYDIIRKLPEGAQVSLETAGDAGQMQIRSGRSRFMLQALPESDFPDLAAGEMPFKFSLPPMDLRRLIDKTQFAISTEETRYYLNGIYFHTIETGGATMLRAVATDGHRLARVEIPAPQGADGMPGVIVPRKAVAEIQKLVEAAEENVSVELSSSKIRVTLGGVVLTSKLIDGTFPDYQRVIPTGNDKRLTVDRDEFAKAVDRVSTISSERGRAVKLALNESRLVLSVTNPDSGSATEELEVDYEAQGLDIGFNARYLLDITGQLDGDTALFKLADPGSPTLIQDREGSPALYVLMPMRV